MVAGGLRHREQAFNPQGARAQATMMTLAAITLILPAAYRAALGKEAVLGLVPLSVAISIVLLLVYALFLAFSLVTHASQFSGIEGGWQMGYLLETLENGWLSVFLPQAPTPMSGNVMQDPPSGSGRSASRWLKP